MAAVNLSVSRGDTVWGLVRNYLTASLGRVPTAGEILRVVRTAQVPSGDVNLIRPGETIQFDPAAAPRSAAPAPAPAPEPAPAAPAAPPVIVVPGLPAPAPAPAPESDYPFGPIPQVTPRPTPPVPSRVPGWEPMPYTGMGDGVIEPIPPYMGGGAVEPLPYTPPAPPASLPSSYWDTYSFDEPGPDQIVDDPFTQELLAYRQNRQAGIDREAANAGLRDIMRDSIQSELNRLRQQRVGRRYTAGRNVQ